MVLLLVGTGAYIADVRLRATPPVPAVALHAGEDVPVGAPAADPVALPGSGSLALEASAGHTAAGPGPQSLAAVAASTARPIASVAKVLTALTALDLRPLASATDEGPPYTMTAADVAIYRRDLAEDGSVVPVAAGETFTERQLLLALMLPSGNNIAETLAVWSAGSLPVFLQRANAKAAALGMTSTRITDPSGLDAGTVSTAADLVQLGRSVLASVPLAAVVTRLTALLPDGSTIRNLDTGLTDVPGWLGIKTGNSTAAGGCLLFAARLQPSGDADPADAVTVVGAVLGIHATTPGATGADDRGAAIFAAERAVTTAVAGFQRVATLRLSPPVTGGVTAPWGPTSAVILGAPSDPRAFLARGGTRLTVRVTVAPVAAPLPVGTAVGRLDLIATDGLTVLTSWPIVTLGRIDLPDWGWRLRNG